MFVPLGRLLDALAVRPNIQPWYGQRMPSDSTTPYASDALRCGQASGTMP